MTLLAFLLGLAFVAAACGDAASTPTPEPPAPAVTDAPTPAPATTLDAPTAEPQAGPDIIPILASSETSIGRNRFLFGLTDRAGELVAAPDVEVELLFYDVESDPDTVLFETDSRFLWAIEDERGLYAADVTYPSAGRWATRFNATFPDGTTETVRAEYTVRETTSTPGLGTAAPGVDTPTATDAEGELARISTDTDPLASLYERSLSEAVASGEPFVVAFVTPAFCQTATCGPTLDKVKDVATANPDVDFIHLEPYVMAFKDERLQPVLGEDGRLQAAEWTLEWGLLTEPFVAVVDSDGNVSAKFEGAITVEELEEALAEV